MGLINFSERFIFQKENNSRLPYLDTVVIRQPDQSLATEWYAKPIASGRLLSFCSFHPLQLKINVAYNFATRVSTLTTARRTQETRNIITQQLKRNSYPIGLINRIVNRTLMCPPPPPPQQVLASTPTQTQTDAQPKQFFSIPYIHTISPAITKTLKTDYPDIQIAYTNTNSVATFFTNVKDPIKTLQHSNVIYKIPCNDCPQSYIGMTTLQLRERLYGHQSDINKLNLLAGRGLTADDTAMVQLRERTALVEHCIDHQHTFGLQQTQIVDRSFKPWNLQFLEMFHILNTPDVVNRRTDVDRISSTYQGILHTIKTIKPNTTRNVNSQGTSNTYQNT